MVLRHARLVTPGKPSTPRKPILPPQKHIPLTMESNPLHPLVIPLYGSTTHFPWGTPGQQSLAAHVGSLNRFGAIDPEKPYSEFVITTHSQHSEAVLASTPSVSLREHIHNQVIEVDSSVVDFYSKLHAKGIPYSLKIACVSTPQSLHAHPSDATVKAFASQEPSSGMDTTSKSVMLVALSKVDMLFGFQAASDIVNELSRVPEFAAAVGRTETDQFVHIVKSAKVKHSHIRVIFTNLFSRTREFMQKCLCATIERMERMPEDALTEKDMQLVELHKLYPDDPACFSVYFLNHIHLEPGNAVFVHPQEPYSILKGQYIEASSCSESSVDGGLTNEEVRIPQFLESLSYDDSAVEVSDGERFSDSGVSFVPPVPDFQLLEFKLPHNTAQQMAETIAPSLLLVLSGEGVIQTERKKALLPMRTGSVYYLNPQTKLLVTSNGGIGSMLHFIQIGVNESSVLHKSSSCTVM